MPARRKKSLAHNNTPVGKHTAVVYHREHRSKKGRKNRANWEDSPKRDKFMAEAKSLDLNRAKEFVIQYNQDPVFRKKARYL
jgi:hypothetical protein